MNLPTHNVLQTEKTMRAASRRAFLKASVCMAPSILLGASRPPNVLLINSDDQRFDTIAALGNREIHTPAFDSLVRRGCSFSNFYSQGGMVPAMCLPSRTMLMTGKSVFHIPERNQPAPEGLPLLAKAFEKAGYKTYHHGKRGNTYLPASEAFQTKRYSEEGSDVRALQSERHADQVIDWMSSNGSAQPFFIYMAPPVPHDPRSAPERFRKLYDPSRIKLPNNFMPAHPFDNGELKIRDEMLAPFPRTPDVMRQHLADYYATISCLDYHAGRIFDALQANGQSGNTLVVFTSDQGLAVGGRHGLMGKQNLYEHFKAPLIFAGLGVPHGRSSAALTHMHDLFPTLCELAGIPAPAGVEGLSLAGIVRGKQTKVRDYAFAVYKDIQRMVRDERWKLLWYPKVSRFQLFDLAKDPSELRDLSSSPAQRKRLAQMKRAMAAQQEFHGDTVCPRPI